MGIFDFLKHKMQIINSDEVTFASKFILTEKIESQLIDYFALKECGYVGRYTFSAEMRSFDPACEQAIKVLCDIQYVDSKIIGQRLSIGYNRTGIVILQLVDAAIIDDRGYCNKKLLCHTEEEMKLRLGLTYNVPRLFNGINQCLINSFVESHRPDIDLKKDYYIGLQEIQFKAEEEEIEKKLIEEEKEKIKMDILIKQKNKKIRQMALEELKLDGIIENTFSREPIPQDVQDTVWNRDGGKCVKCGSQENLEFDHIIPFSKGGSNNVRNLQLLCQKCNREKSNKIG